ncbi:hypothetical protein LTR10_013687 [Elasticomyces elasticus]|uniref:NmrA-like domain-containing protein n=1 Tax=Exophiala sideris TaxID=1016849 RepID=A0ABR0JGQ6_9EURO|nr:hypothetical protein LTR10_013687 [Elasticomyces elasticus]KAK5033338.1 hypothetical protein LTS07_003640 [Exophiala sideris]KAK5042165.1 hypothetical protein LTR13_001971 [Exophiala sideris]KAK5063882.1 hypothetical protein LTR69_003648 [Exophiala sideris]KAK5185433.1 hypothetical protein LTR44_002422 [Eurotiomycetes sp. CCFEE 6388]
MLGVEVALIGATGTLGSEILSALLAQPFPQYQITVITRSKNPDIASHPRITIKEGSYDDHAFLVAALTGQDALVITLGFSVCHILQPLIIRAACEAKVPYILPCEFGSDTSNPRLISAIPVHSSKVDARKLVEELGTSTDGTRTSSWIGIINNAWFDWSLAGGWFGIDIKFRKVTLFDGDGIKTYTSTIHMSGLTVARLFALPITVSGRNLTSSVTSNDSKPQRTLASFANKMVYVANFRLSQLDIFQAVQRATHTTDADWDVAHVPLAQYIRDGSTKLDDGDNLGIMNLLYGNLFVKGVADAYYLDGSMEEVGLNNDLLGLEDCENLDDVVRRVVEEVTEGK